MVLLIWSLICSTATSWAQNFVIVTDDTGRIYTLFSNGNGTFGPLTQIDDRGSNTRGAAIGDFDEDGVLDFIAGDGDNKKINPVFYKGVGNGTFQPGVPLPSTSGGSDGYMMGAAAADFDFDGNLDFLVNGNGDNVGFYWGNGNGTFTLENRGFSAAYGRDMDAGDFNEDGKEDLIRGTANDGIIRLYLSMGNRTFGNTFSNAITVGDAGSDPYGVVAGDFNCDRHLDVLATAGKNGGVTFFAGNGNATFQTGVPRPELNVGTWSAMDAFDFNRDGYLDVVLTNYTGRKVFSRPDWETVPLAHRSPYPATKRETHWG